MRFKIVVGILCAVMFALGWAKSRFEDRGLCREAGLGVKFCWSNPKIMSGK